MKKSLLLTLLSVGILASLTVKVGHADQKQTNISLQETIKIPQAVSLAPEITRVSTSDDGYMYAYLNEPIDSQNYAVALVYGQDIGSLGDVVVENNNVIGFKLNLSHIAQYLSSDIDTILTQTQIRVINTVTGEAQNYNVNNSEMMDVLKNLTHLEGMNLLSGNSSISGTSTPGSKITLEDENFYGPNDILGEVIVDTTGKFSLPVSVPLSGYSVYRVTSTGQYGEKIVASPKVEVQSPDENLFFNPLMEDQAEGWRTLGANQQITNNLDGITNFSVIDGGISDHLGAIQTKYSVSETMILSFDVKVNSVMSDAASSPLLVIGSVMPGGGELLFGSKEIPIFSEDLSKWKHVEIELSPFGVLVAPYGFTTDYIKDMDVKNMSLILKQ